MSCTCHNLIQDKVVVIIIITIYIYIYIAIYVFWIKLLKLVPIVILYNKYIYIHTYVCMYNITNDSLYFYLFADKQAV